MRILPMLLALFSTGSSFFLVPDDVVSFLNAFYSRVPPVRIGMNNTKVGLGFRVGRNVDVQFLVELGPQDAPRPTVSSKREVPLVKNPVITVQNNNLSASPSLSTFLDPATADENKRQEVQNLVATDHNTRMTSTTPNPLRVRNRWSIIHNPVTKDQNKKPIRVLNQVRSSQNKRPTVRDPVTTVINRWPTVETPVSKAKPAVFLPFDFISRLRQKRPGITAPTTRRPDTTTEILTTEIDIEENEIDSGHT